MPGQLTLAEVAAAFDLRGRHALVTGASRGAGLATACALASSGASVVACHDGDDEAAHRLAQELKATGGDHQLVDADLTRPAGVAAVVRTCQVHLGRLDVVVTTADAGGRVPLAELSTERWRHDLDATLTAAMLVTQGVQPLLGKDASIVYLTAATRGEAGASAPATAAAGLIGLTRSLAKELGPHGTRVNLVATGPVAEGRDEQIAAVALFLASPESGGITGETVVVDGGA